MDRCLGQKDVQEILGVGKNVAYQLFHRRDFPGFKIAGKWRVKKTDLESWIEKQKKKEGR